MKNVPMKGIITPILTPMNPDETVNLEVLRQQIERLIEGGVHGIFPIGTNGEAYALSAAEKDRVLEEYGLAQGTEEALKSLGPDVLIAMRKGRYHAKGLVNNRQEAARREPSLLVEPARLEDIMVMMAKEEESWLG